jgi:outer membrane protein assembly factor BamB
MCLVDLLPSHAPAEQLSAKEPASADLGWPHLRGPHYDAVSTDSDLADSWPADGPPLLWNREIGAGYSAFIVVGNRAYTQAQTLTKQKLLALDADTGRTVWEYDYDWPYDPGGMYPGPRATPTLSHGRIYFASPDGLVGCLRADDGKPVWSLNVKQKFDGRGTDFGYSCSPIVEEGKVILPVGGPSASMVALDADSGATVWTAGSAPASYCSAVPITFRGRRQVVAFMQNELDGFDLATGRLLWHESYSRGYDEHSNSPLYNEPYLRIMQPFRAGSDLYKIEEVAGGSISHGSSDCRLVLVRHDQKMSNDVASSALVDGYVYGFDLHDIQTSRHRPSRGEFRCMDFKTGNILWSSDRPGQATIVVSRSAGVPPAREEVNAGETPAHRKEAGRMPALQKLLFFNDRGEVLLVRANPRRYEELGRTEVFRGEICWTAPALDHGRLYLRSPTHAACLYVGKPEQMSGRQRELATPTSSIPKGHRLEWSWLIGAERECPFELPNVRELLQWYLWSLAAIVAAWLTAAAVQVVLWFRYGASARRLARIVFWLGLLVLGMAATPTGNRFSSEFVLTWPLPLFAVHQLALLAVLRSGQPERGWLAAWIGVLGVGFLILTSFAYYELTRSLSLAPAWYFLLTFLPAWPLAVPAARRHQRPGNLGIDLVWMLVAFSVYFWLAGGLLLGRAALGR